MTHHDVYMRTTISINDALLEELRARAAETGKTFRQVLEETLRLGLGAGRARPQGAVFRVRPHPLGLKPGFHGVSLNQLYDQLEAEEGRYRAVHPGSQSSQRVAEDPR